MPKMAVFMIMSSLYLNIVEAIIQNDSEQAKLLNNCVLNGSENMGVSMNGIQSPTSQSIDNELHVHNLRTIGHTTATC